jgi:hypothetical protein
MSKSATADLDARPGMTKTCVIAPCLVRPQGAPVILFLLPRRGVRNDWAESRARGVRMFLMHTDIPPAVNAKRPAGGGSTHRRRTMKKNRGHRSRSSPAFRTRMDFAACCLSQEASLVPTLSRSCELSPGHALGPSARVAGVSPCHRSGSSMIPKAARGSGIVAATATRSTTRRRSRRAPDRSGMGSGYFGNGETVNL